MEAGEITRKRHILREMLHIFLSSPFGSPVLFCFVLGGLFLCCFSSKGPDHPVY